MVTMNDIAKKAGISRQAVSSVLNNPEKSRVSAEMKKRIFQLIDELKYVPNTTAKVLKGGSSGSIGLTCSLNSFGVHSMTISKISELLHQKKYDIILSNCITHDNNIIDNGIKKLEMKGVDGIIILNTSGEKLPKLDINIPYVICNGNIIKNYDVAIDKEYGAYIATKHLIEEHGHKNIGYICVRDFQRNDSRGIGWQRACEEFNCYNPENWFATSNFNGETIPLISELKKRKITALFAYNDYLAANLISILFNHNIRVPEDIAIIGCDGQSFCDFCQVPLATIIQPIEEFAKYGVEILFDRIKNKTTSHSYAHNEIKPILHTSKSCGCASSKLDKLYTINTYSTLEMDYKINHNIDILNPK